MAADPGVDESGTSLTAAAAEEAAVLDSCRLMNPGLKLISLMVLNRAPKLV